MNRVVITGIGVVSPVGCLLQDFWSALVEGHSAIGPFSVARSGRLTARIAAQVSRFDPAAHFEPKQLSRNGSFLAVRRGGRARRRAHSGLDISERLALDMATVIGNASAGQTTLDNAYFRLYSEKTRRACIR